MTCRFNYLLHGWCTIALAGCFITAASASDQATGPRDPAEPVMNRLFEHRLEIESDRILSVNYFNIPLDHAAAADPSHFIITSPDDPAYAADRAVRPTASGSRMRTVRVSLRDGILIKGSHVFLHLPTALQPGATYRVAVDPTVTPGTQPPTLPAVLFDDRRLVNDNFRINQLGYCLDLPKIAYLGEYLGTLGKLEINADTFELLDQTGKAVFQAALTRRGTGEELVGQAVYELDFTAFDQPGTYRLRVPGVGVSYPFRIADDAMLAAYGNLMRGLYHQRSGQAIDPTYSRHARPAGHVDDALLDPASEERRFVNPKNPPLYPTRFDDPRRIAAPRGHHDAGDYGKYTTNGSDVVHTILTAFAVFGDRVARDDAFVPFAGNGIPDLIDTVKWELDWLEQMQDPDDGAVFGVIKPADGGYESSMPTPNAGRFFYPKDTPYTASYAAALALASRSPEINTRFPEAAKRYLARAEKAWAWLEKNHRHVEYFHYGKLFGDADERVWAAVELYLATGKVKYHRYVLEHFDPGQKRWDWKLMEGSLGPAVLSYLLAPKDQTDPAMRDRCLAALTEKLDAHVSDSALHPYRLSLPQPMIRDGRYGWLFPGNEFGFDLIVGYQLTGQRDYLEAAYHNHAYSLGANPFGFFQQTGLGHKRNFEVVDQETHHDGIVEPVPGLPLGIGTPHFYYINKYGRAIGADTYPSDPEYPQFNRWYDGFNVRTEFTIEKLTREAVVAAYFANEPTHGNPTPNRPPTLRLEADAIIGHAPFTTQLRATAEDPDGEIIFIYWDFGDESAAVGPEVTHTFDEPGREYDVTVTATDQHGAIAYQTIRIACPPETATATLTPPDGMQRVWHADFNGTLQTTGRLAAPLQPFSTSDPDAVVPDIVFGSAPAWSEQDGARVLNLDGSIALRSDLGKAFDPMFQPRGKVVIDARLRVDEFTGWGVSNAPATLGIVNSWDAWFGLEQGTWDRARTPSVGTKFIDAVTAKQVAQAWPLQSWVVVRVTLTNTDDQTQISLEINGKPVGSAAGKPLSDRRNRVSTLEFGNFRGAIDDLSVYVSP